MEKVKSKIMIFFLCFLVWIALSWEVSVASIVIGLAVALLTTVIIVPLFRSGTTKWMNPKRYMYFALYIFVFLKECVKANVDVALRIIKPNMPINPGIVKVRTSLRSEAALTFLANSITLTPGTLCVDIDGDEGVLYIHWIDVKDKDITKASDIIVKKFEGIIGKALE